MAVTLDINGRPPLSFLKEYLGLVDTDYNERCFDILCSNKFGVEGEFWRKNR
jgi:hypothetical protein